MSCEYSFGLKELQSKGHNLAKALIGEFIGNFILNFFASGACTQPEDGTFKALAFGFAVFVAITAVGQISGGHINPAVTISMLIVGRVSVLRALLYIVFQCLGSAAGTLSIKTLIDEIYYNGLGHTSLAPNITNLQGVGIEFFLGFIIVITVFGVCDVNKPDSKYTGPLAIGMAVAVGHLGTIRYTGAGMNPARSFGTAYATNNWTVHWIYWLGPILGGITAALIYTQFLAMPITAKDNKAAEKYRTHMEEREKKKLPVDRDFA